MNKKIKALLCGAFSLALFACSESDSNSAAPEQTPTSTDSTANGSITDAKDSLNQILPDIGNPEEMDSDTLHQDSSDIEDIEASQDGFIESVLRKNSVDNAVEIDCFLSSDDLERTEPCGQSRLSLSKGNLIHRWLGETNEVRCERDSADLIRYEISVPYGIPALDSADHFVKKQLSTNNEQVIAAFETDCEIEGGTNSLKENGTHLCSIKASEDPSIPHAVFYTDPDWKKYVKAVVNVCKGEPIDINPSAAPPTDFDEPERIQPNKVKMGECKDDGFSARSALAKDVASELPKAKIISDDNGKYEIMIPNVSDYCVIVTGVVRELVGNELYIRYDIECKEHEAHFNATDNEGCGDCTIAPIRRQFDETCSPGIVSKCVCVSDHYFPIDKEYLSSIEYVIFNEVSYPIEQPVLSIAANP